MSVLPAQCRVARALIDMGQAKRCLKDKLSFARSGKHIR
jgi:hypothetical protein